MGFELNRIMKQYGVGTPGQVNYSGTAAPSVPTAPAGTRPAGEDAGAKAAQATYDKQLANFNAYKADPAAFNETMRKYGLDQKSYDTYKTDYQNRLQNTPMYAQTQFQTTPQPVANTVTDLYKMYLGRDPEAGIVGTAAASTRPNFIQEAQRELSAKPTFGNQNLMNVTGSYYGNQLTSPTYGAMPASMINATPQEKSDYYLKQRNFGYNNADLRTASENTFGKVNEGDWAQMTARAYPQYNQNIVDAYKSIGRTWEPGSAGGQIDAPGYNYWMNQLSSGAFDPKNLNSTFAQAAADEKAKATVKAYTGGSVNELAAKYAQGGGVSSPGQAAAYYKQRAQDGYTDSEIRAASDNIFGVSSDADWQYIKSIANVGAAPTMSSTSVAPISIAGTNYNGGGGDSYVDPNPGWSDLTPAEQASFFQDPANQTHGAIRGVAQGLFAYTTPGFIQNMFSPSTQPAAMAISKGQTPQQTFRGLELNVQDEVDAAYESARAAKAQNFVDMQYMQNALMDDTNSLNAAVAAQQDALAQSQNQALNDMSGRQESQMNAGPDVGGGQASSSGISSDGQGGYGGTAGSNGPGDGTSSDYAYGGKVKTHYQTAGEVRLPSGYGSIDEEEDFNRRFRMQPEAVTSPVNMTMPPAPVTIEPQAPVPATVIGNAPKSVLTKIAVNNVGDADAVNAMNESAGALSVPVDSAVVAAAPKAVMPLGGERMAGLQAMLATYGPKDSAYAADLKIARDRATADSDAFAKMLTDSMKSPEDAQSSKAEMYFRLAAAFGAPTKTGQFSENLGMVGKELGEYAKGKRASAKEKQLLGLEVQKLKMASSKEDLNTLRALSAEEIKDKRAISTELIKDYIKSGEPQSAAGKQAADEGLKIGTPAYQKRVEAIGNMNVEAKLAQINSALAGMTTQAAMLALAQQKFAQARDQQAKLTPAELALKVEAENLVGSSKQSLADLKKAYSLNDNSLAGGWLSQGQQFLAEKAGSEDPVIVNTRILNNLLGAQGLAKLKATFGGAPTEGERAILMELEGIGSKTLKERKAIILRSYQVLQDRVAREQARLDQINSGAYRSTTPIDGGTD